MVARPSHWRARFSCRRKLSVRRAPSSSSNVATAEPKPPVPPARITVLPRRESAVRAMSELHTLEFAVERLTLDPQNLRGLALVAAGGCQHPPDLVFLSLRERLHGLVAALHNGE